MANNEILQATVAYKVSKPEGQPLDINGQLTSISRLRQAIFLLQGAANPSPALYEVEGRFVAGAVVAGESTQKYDPLKCPSDAGIWVAPARLTLIPQGASKTIVVYSSAPWAVVAGGTGTAALSRTSGPAGFTYVSVRPANGAGQREFLFRNTVSQATASLYVVTTLNPNLWVLETGNWQNLGFWFDNGVWKY